MPTRPVAFRTFVAGLLLLTVATGAVDAISYLALDRVFTGNMTGNVLFLGFALAGVAGIPFLNNAIALVGFVVGSIVGGRVVGRGHPVGFPHRSTWTLASGGVVMLALTVFWFVVGDLAEWQLLVVTFLLALVMGAQIAAVKPIGNADVTTVVVTNTLANLARESRAGGGSGANWAPRLLAVTAMGVGALIGAVAIQWLEGPWALVAAVVVYAAAIGVLVTGGVRARRAATPAATAAAQPA